MLCIEEKIGGIPEMEARLLDGLDLDLKECKNRPQVNAILRQVEKDCELEKKALEKLLKENDFSKQELRQFNFELRKEVLQLVEEQDSIPLSMKDYLEAMSDVIFMFREMSSMVGKRIDSEIITRREMLSPAMIAVI